MIAENRFELTEELFREGFAAIQGNYRRFVRRLILVLAMLWLALAAFVWYRGASVVYAILELAVLVFVGVYAGMYLPKRKAKAAFEAIQRRTGYASERATRFFEDRLEADAGGETATLLYRDIVSREESARLLILVGSDKRGFMIKKDGFVQGSLAAALSAIEKANAEEKYA